MTLTEISNFDLTTGKYYFGSLCKRGHRVDQYGRSLRRKSNRNCVICGRIKSYDWGIDNPTRKSKIQNEHNKKDSKKAADKRYNAKHPNRGREWYLANREACLAKAKAYRERTKLRNKVQFERTKETLSD